MKTTLSVEGLDVSVDGEKVEVRKGDRLVGRGKFVGGRCFSTYVDHASTSLDTLDAIEEAIRSKLQS